MMGTIPSTGHSLMNKHSPGSGGISSAAGSRTCSVQQGHLDEHSNFQLSMTSILFFPAMFPFLCLLFRLSIKRPSLPNERLAQLSLCPLGPFGGLTVTRVFKDGPCLKQS